MKKHVLADSLCEICSPEEDCNHIMFCCSFASTVWATLDIDASACAVSQLREVPRPQTIPRKHFDCFILLLCWHIWKHRNDVVFGRAPLSTAGFWASCREDARLWSNRWPVEDRMLAESWCSLFTSM
jgi:hypothetical protein